MQKTQTYSSNECNEYNIIIDNIVVAYYIEHFKNPNDDTILDNPIFEIYYNFNNETEEFESSLVTEYYDDLQSIIEDLQYA